jgi:hypothetical protein
LFWKILVIEEGTESADIATNENILLLEKSGALGMRQHFNAQNRHGPKPEYNWAILVFVTPRMSTKLVKSMKKRQK